MARKPIKKHQYQHVIHWEHIVLIIALMVVVLFIIHKSPADAGERIWISTVTSVQSILEKSWVSTASIVANFMLSSIVLYLYKKCDISWTLHLDHKSDMSSKNQTGIRE